MGNFGLHLRAALRENEKQPVVEGNRLVDLLVNMVGLWFLIIGVLLLGIALVGSYVKRVPLSTAILYLAVGYVLGPQGSGLIEIDLIRQAAFIERVTEVAVIVSLFTAGLKLRIPLRDSRWRRPLRLAFGSMTFNRRRDRGGRRLRNGTILGRWCLAGSHPGSNGPGVGQ